MNFWDISVYEFITGIFNFFESTYIFGFSTIENYITVSLMVTLILFVLYLASSVIWLFFSKEKQDESFGVFIFCVPAFLMGFLWPVTIPASLGMIWGAFFSQTAHLGS